MEPLQYSSLSISVLLILVLVFVPGLESFGQCTFLRPSELKQLARISFEKKLIRLKKVNAKLLSQRSDHEKCEYRTYTRCKNYISDSQWHWAEIISFNSCDQIVSYSTSEEEHFLKLKTDLTKRFTLAGTRSYDGLEFEVFQNRRQAIEINQHPNEQGKMFYLINIIKSN